MIALLIRHKSPFIHFAMALACLFLASVSLRAQSSSAEIPEPTGNAVNDFANVIDAQTEQRLETTLINLKREQKIEFSVATVRTTGGMDIFDYTLAVGRKWGIGPQEGSREGLLLMVAVDDGKYFTLVSRHLQGELTDGVVGSLQRQYLVPAFRAGDYSKGISDTMRAYIDTLSEKRGFSTTGIYPQDEPSRPRRQPASRTGTRGASGSSTCCVLFIILVVVIILFSSNRGGGRGGGGGGGGLLNLLVLGSLLNAGSRGGWSSGGWSGGDGGGFGGGGGDGGGFGGFGGGGDFDGGGAGGSW